MPIGDTAMPKTTRAAHRRLVPALLAAAMIALAAHGTGVAGGTGAAPQHRLQARHQTQTETETQTQTETQIAIAIDEHVAGVPCSACGGGV